MWIVKLQNIFWIKNINIIIGENETGKNTILEVINICLNQLYRNTDKSIIKNLLNINSVFKSKYNGTKMIKAKNNFSINIV